jgi:DNA-binding GntR family transcriptional regulator
MAGTSILADRMAALLGNHEPGWRLPRQSALARRFNVSVPEVDAAVTELMSRHLLRRLPDGQVYRASPADYLISLEDLRGLTSQIDPMGAQMACESRHVSWRRVPEEIGRALGLEPGDQVCVVRYLWQADGARAALSTTYLPERLAVTVPALDHPADASTWVSVTPVPEPNETSRWTPVQPGSSADPRSPAVPLNVVRLLAPAGPSATAHAQAGGPAGNGAPPAEPAELAGEPRALHMEMQLPPPSVARSLGLAPDQCAVIVSMRFDHPSRGTPVALTVVVLRPDAFRIVITSGTGPLADSDYGGLAGAWAHVAEDLDPGHDPVAAKEPAPSGPEDNIPPP